MMQRSLIWEAERQAYGDEALSVMARKAQEVVQPFVDQVTQQNRMMQQELARVKSNDIYGALDQQLPDWRRINQDQDWKDWLAQPDIYNGTSRQLLLNQAFAAGDADRVLQFFRGFLAENTQQPAARASRMSADNSRPIITDKEIQAFYDRVRKGSYEGRSKDKDREEAMIHRAILEGRLRRSTS
jgi:hypothetical protein